MPLTPQQDALCHKLEQQLGPEGLDAASIIRQQASEIDGLWDRLNHAYMVMRENIGDVPSPGRGRPVATFSLDPPDTQRKVHTPWECAKSMTHEYHIRVRRASSVA
jgi:hypothetical protein